MGGSDDFDAEFERRLAALMAAPAREQPKLIRQLAAFWYERRGARTSGSWTPDAVVAGIHFEYRGRFDGMSADASQRFDRAFQSQLRCLEAGTCGVSPNDSSRRGRNAKADPVEHARGELVHEATDLIVRGAGIDFAFTRTYRHQTIYKGPLGHRWDHGYNLFLRVDDLGATLWIGAGRSEEYRRHGHWGAAGCNYYVPPDGVDATLEPLGPPDAPNGWVRRASDGLHHVFSPHPAGGGAWRLTRIEDRWGNYLSFDYDTPPSGEPRIARVHVNHAARWVQFAYDELDRIVRLTDHTGRVWRYRYDSHGDLIGVTTPPTESSPRGDTTTYRYSSAERSGPLAHLLTDIFDAAGRHYLHTVYGVDTGDDSFGRVVRQRVGSGEYAFRYEEIPSPDLSLPLEDRPTTRCWVRERNGYQTLYVYNPWGALLWKQETDKGPGHAPRPAVWQYRYNRDGALVASRSPEGVVSQVITGRDHFLRKRGLGRAAGDDDRLWDNAALTADVRRGFGRVLATVERAQRHPGAPIAWSDRFGDVYAVVPDDIVVRYTYEGTFGQLQTVSDPRVTTASDPDAIEPRHDPLRPSDYEWRLTRHVYAGATRDLMRTIAPTQVLPDEHGTIGDPVVTEILERDPRGRVKRVRDPVGTETLTQYVEVDDARNGFVQSVTLDPGEATAGHLNLETSYTVDDLGRVIATTLPRAIEGNADDFVVTAEYDRLDRVVRSRTSSPPTETRTTYEAAGKPRTIETDWTSPLGPTPGPVGQRFVYDEEHRVREEYAGGSDVRDQTRVAHRYNAAGQRTVTVAANDSATIWRYDSRDELVQAVHGPGIGECIEEIHRDRDGRVVAQKSPEGRTSTFEHDGFGRVVQVTDPAGHITRTSYDKGDRPLVVRHFERAVTAEGAESFTLLARSATVYDELGRPVRAITSRFATPPPPATRAELAIAYEDGVGTAVESREVETRTFYDAAGRIVRVVDALGHATVTEYDAAGRVVRAIGPAGDEVRARYDAHGNATRVDRIDVVHDVNGMDVGTEAFTLLATFDARDRLTTEADALGNVTTHEYDSLDREVRTTDPLGNVVEQLYDIHGHLIEVRASETTAGGGTGDGLLPKVTRFEHDRAGLVTARIDARGRRTELRYDKQNRLVEETLPGDDGSRLVTQYNRDSQVTAVRDAHGVVVRTLYDEAGWPLQTIVDTAEVDVGITIEGSRQLEYAYDGLGRTRWTRNETATITTTFDSLGLTTREETSVQGQGTPTVLRIDRKFDDLGRLTGLVYPGGRSLAYGYDGASRMREIQHVADGADYPGARGGVRKIANYAYAGDRVRTIAFGNRTSATFTHDAGGAVVELDHTGPSGTLLRVQELRDGVGSPRLRREERPEGIRLERFGYDSHQQLTARADAAPDLPLALGPIRPPPAPPPGPPLARQPVIDALIGPRIGVKAPPGADGWEYDKVGNRLSTTVDGGVTGYVPDARDRYEQVGTAQHRYDRAGNLIFDGVHDFVYDGFRRLVSIRRHDTQTEVARYAYDPAGRRVVEERPDEPPLVISYDGVDRIADFRDGRCIAQYVHGPAVDDPIELAARGAQHTYHTDLQGSVCALTTAAGTIAASYRFDPFGTLVASAGPALGPPTVDTPAGSQPLGYGSRPLEPVTGHYDLRARVYSPEVGRFLQRDPAGAVDGHLYAFAGNHPLAFGDPSGLERAERFTEAALDFGAHVLGGFDAAFDALANPTASVASAHAAVVEAATVAAEHGRTTRGAANLRNWASKHGYGGIEFDYYSAMTGTDPSGWTAMREAVKEAYLAAGGKIYETRGGAIGAAAAGGANFGAGLFDEITFGGTRYLRGLTSWDDAVDYSSDAYTGGGYAGLASAIVPGRALVKFGMKGLRRLASGTLRRGAAGSTVLRVAASAPGARRTNARLIQDIATRAERKIGGSGRVAGIHKHTYAKRLLVKYQKMHGNRGLEAEVSYFNRQVQRYGFPGSVRLDVLEAGAKTVYDYKFTRRIPGLSWLQAWRIRRHGPPGIANIVEVNP